MSADGTTMISVPGEPGRPVLVLHGGAGGRVEELALDGRAEYARGLRTAYDAGWAVLEAGGTALDAVCAAVVELENDPLFNAGRGAALTRGGTAELDASLMDGGGPSGVGSAGAVAVARSAKNPVLAARHVLEHSEHVLLVEPSTELLESWGLHTVSPEYFVTDARLQQLERVQAREIAGSRHGTVGAVARDASGGLAAATSTGGMVNQSEGRVGDTPVIGSGTYARNGTVAVSCTGHGESFIEGVVAHDIAARIRYASADLRSAVLGTIDDALESRGSTGGLVSLAADGTAVIAHNSPAMFAAYFDGSKVVTLA